MLAHQLHDPAAQFQRRERGGYLVVTDGAAIEAMAGLALGARAPAAHAARGQERAGELIEEAACRVVDLTGQVNEPRTSVECMPPGVEVRAENARRIVAERCLYGVNLNPLAVELAKLAKLSLWLVTLSKGRPFGFLDHHLRRGDSLLGISRLESTSTNSSEAVFGTLEAVLVKLRVALEVVWVGARSQARGQIVPRTLFGGRWEEHGRGLVQSCRR